MRNELDESWLRGDENGAVGIFRRNRTAEALLGRKYVWSQSMASPSERLPALSLSLSGLHIYVAQVTSGAEKLSHSRF